MHVSYLTNHYLYWVDRFDHVLSIEECNNRAFMSFTDLAARESDQVLVTEYCQVEDRLIGFIEAVVEHADTALQNSFVRYSWFSAGAETSLPLFTPAQLAIHQDIATLDRGDENCLQLESKAQLRDFLQLGIRERLKVKLLIGEVYVETGFDMGLVVQNIREDNLLQLASRTGVHVLRKWEHSMWD
ncbi:hypothetical protein [Hymenobacter cellulosilyticus]|uniref:Uncharacterized protein n=1 Tax=Hymenobacter cellulosilyticus TaxID=2932248 RepID=A0A8T9Q639_9BACT|nr:hypothetical protein [Hymenobacter cellulosilyticus]UOQ70533.1 hypothetical protein MUN79_17630 [Hymenobacter cellulosilyticus]